MLARLATLFVSSNALASALAPARPTLYVYDHCPFCVRARLAFGLKGIKHDVRFMANDDVDLPTSLVGKKIAPIFDDGNSAPYAESLDIVRNVDADPAYGTPGAFRPLSDRTDLKAWQKSVQTLLRKLQRPRYVMVPLPEFMQKDGRDAFVANHAVTVHAQHVVAGTGVVFNGNVKHAGRAVTQGLRHVLVASFSVVKSAGGLSGWSGGDRAAAVG